MQKGLNRNYVSSRLRKSSFPPRASAPETAPSPKAVSLVPSAEVAELITFGKGAFYKKVINALFAKKETLKKLPVIGTFMIGIKRKMAEASRGELRFDDIVSLPRRHFVAELYRRALGREADYHDLRNYDMLNFMGMNNLATVYLVCTSPEFGGRARVANMNVYRKAYGRYKIKSFIFNVPVLGHVARLFAVPSAMRIIADKFLELEAQLEIHEGNSARRDYRVRQDIERYGAAIPASPAAAEGDSRTPEKRRTASRPPERRGGKK